MQRIIDVNNSISSTAFATNMVVFNDPILMFLGFLSMLISLITSVHDLDKTGELKVTIHAFYILIRSAFWGIVSPILMFLVLVNYGDIMIMKWFKVDIGDNLMIIVPIFFLISLSFSRIIFQKIVAKLDKKEVENDKS